MRINFSEKPCVGKKEKVINIYLPLLFIVIVSLLNLFFFVYYRMENSSSHLKINKLRKKIAEYNMKISKDSAFLKQIQYKRFKKEYLFFYSLTIKKRLKWADLFDQFEKSLPKDVKLSMISPKVEGNSILLSISAEAKSKESELKFIENLENNRMFEHAFIEYESIDPVTGAIKCSVSVRYRDRL